LRLDSRAPTIRFEEFARSEARFAMLGKVDPEGEEELLRQAQADIDDRWHYYEQMVHVHRTAEYAEVEE
jgi:pyruvate-ferredoxin/flavodoxin oxidoreductase